MNNPFNFSDSRIGEVVEATLAKNRREGTKTLSPEIATLMAISTQMCLATTLKRLGSDIMSPDCANLRRSFDMMIAVLIPDYMKHQETVFSMLSADIDDWIKKQKGENHGG